MKKFVWITTLLCFIFCSMVSFPAYAAESGDEFSIGEGLTWDFNESTGTLTISGNGEMVDEMYENTPWLEYADSIRQIVVRDGVTRLGGFAFSELQNLTRVSLSASVTDLGYYAFCNCPSLAEINIPYGVTSINDCTFAGCSALTSVYLPESVESIGTSAFAECSSLHDINFPSHLTFISDSFANCTSLTSVTLPDGITTIGPYTFMGCTSLSKINIPASLESIYDGCFQGCSSLTDISIDPENPYYFLDEAGALLTKDGLYLISIPCNYSGEYVVPQSVAYLCTYCFADCTQLTGVVLPEEITQIPEGCFFGCTSLQAIELPEHLEFISGSAFEKCTNLREISIPDTVTYIGMNAFDESGAMLNPDNQVNGCVYFGDWFIGVAPDFSGTKIQIKDGCKFIYEYSLFKSNITEIELPESVEDISSSALNYCYDLEKLTVLNPECQFDSDETMYVTPLVYGFSGSTAEEFASWNHLQFEPLDAPEEETATEETSEAVTEENSNSSERPEKDSKWLRIGISGGVIVLFAVVMIFLKKKKHGSNSEEI